MAGEAKKLQRNISLTDVGIGTPAGTGITVEERGNDVLHQTIITLTSVSIAMTDTGGANGGYGSQKIYDFPEGLIQILGAVSNLSYQRNSTGITATATVKHSLGSAAEASNDTLDSTQANIIPSTSGALTAGAGTGAGVSTAAATLDGTSTAVDAILNLGIADAGISATDGLTVSGTVTITWANCGDK